MYPPPPPNIFIDDAYDFNLNLHPVCVVNVLLKNEHILDLFFQTVRRFSVIVFYLLLHKL